MTDDPLQCSAVRFDRKALSLATLLLPLLGCHHSPAARFPPGHAVLTDPAGDAVAAPNSGPAPDMVSGTADVVNGQITFAVRFARGTLDHRTTRVTIEVDVDRNQSTGRQTGVGLGIDYVIDLWAGSGAANIMQAVAGTCTVNSPCYTSVGNAPLRIGGDSVWGEYFQGLIDEVRVYKRALSQGEIQADMSAPVGGAALPDTTAPTVSIVSPAAGATVKGSTTITATASDNVGVGGVQFLLDGAPLGSEDTTSPYSIVWDTTLQRAIPPEKLARVRNQGIIVDGWIIPEFTWDPTNSFLFWTEQRFPDGLRVQAPFCIWYQTRKPSTL